MERSNPKYQNQGIHVIGVIFTVQKGIVKVLLVRRKNEPFKDMWALVGGALYNDEDLDVGIKREIYEKTGIQKLQTNLFSVFGKVNRSPVMRMVALGYMALVDGKKVEFFKETLRTSNADWFSVDSVPDLAYDHNEIMKEALVTLKQKIIETDILKSLYPTGFTIPEIQKVYEAILDKVLDRRNFRKKMLGLGLIYDTEKQVKFEGKKPAKLYKFKDNIENKNVF